jgi:hypothetical protein
MADDKLKGTASVEDKEILVDPNNLDKKHQIGSNLDPKYWICPGSPGR